MEEPGIREAGARGDCAASMPPHALGEALHKRGCFTHFLEWCKCLPATSSFTQAVCGHGFSLVLNRSFRDALSLSRIFLSSWNLNCIVVILHKSIPVAGKGRHSYSCHDIRVSHQMRKAALIMWKLWSSCKSSWVWSVGFTEAGNIPRQLLDLGGLPSMIQW